MRHPAEFCAKVANAFPGELVRIRVGLGSFVLATDPLHVEHILIGNESNYWKGELFNTMRPFFGDSLLLSEGEHWRHQRRYMQPYFRVLRLRSLACDFEQIIERVTENWHDGASIDVEKAMRNITLRIILHAMFSSSLREEDIGRIETELERFLSRVPLSVFSWWAPGIAKTVLRGPSGRLDGPVLRLIRERRGASERPDDLLTALLSTANPDGSPLSDKQIRDQVVTIVFGGYEATATALYWTWLMLSRHPLWRERVYAEIDSSTTTDELPSLQQVIDETLRLFPSFWFSSRTAHHADKIGPYALEAGTSVVISPYAVHRQPRYWPEPDRFDPNRFAPGKELLHPCAYIPFLRGPRMCIGKHFADLEMRLVTKVIGRRWRLDLADPDWVLATEAQGSLRPRGRPAMRLCRR